MKGPSLEDFATIQKHFLFSLETCHWPKKQHTGKCKYCPPGRELRSWAGEQHLLGTVVGLG